MSDLLKEQAGGADGLIAVPLVEPPGRFARVKNHPPGPPGRRPPFELMQECAANPLALKAGLHRHEANLGFQRRVEMEASHAD